MDEKEKRDREELRRQLKNLTFTQKLEYFWMYYKWVIVIVIGVIAALAAVGFLLFTLLYTPCVAAVATLRRELRSMWATVGVVVLQCAIAWVVAFAVFQIGGLFL